MSFQEMGNRPIVRLGIAPSSSSSSLWQPRLAHRWENIWLAWSRWCSAMMWGSASSRVWEWKRINSTQTHHHRIILTTPPRFLFQKSRGGYVGSRMCVCRMRGFKEKDDHACCYRKLRELLIRDSERDGLRKEDREPRMWLWAGGKFGFLMYSFFENKNVK